MMMRFRESPEPPPPDMVPPGNEEKIMHACMRINGQSIMASDGGCGNNAMFDGFSLSLNANDEAEADRMFGRLSEDGKVEMPMGPTFFAKRFGMVRDKFGVGWMVIVPPDEA